MIAMRSEPLSLSARFALPGASSAKANSYSRLLYFWLSNIVILEESLVSHGCDVWFNVFNLVNSVWISLFSGFPYRNTGWYSRCKGWFYSVVSGRCRKFCKWNDACV